jgi:hypothetical protein
MDRVGVEPTTSAHSASCVIFLLVYFFLLLYTNNYSHSYAVALNFWDSGSDSKSSAIIRLLIQDNFCEFVNPVIMVNPFELSTSFYRFGLFMSPLHEMVTTTTFSCHK